MALESVLGLVSSNIYNPDNDIPDLSSRVYAVTGGTAGIGFGIVAHLLQHNASKIIVLSNTEQRAEEALDKLKDWGPAERVKWVQCDLRDLHSVKEAAGKVEKEAGGRLDALVCNAGYGVAPYEVSKDGIDAHFQTNVLSHFLLAALLFPLLKSTPNARLVMQSSSLHNSAPSDVQFASLDEINQDIGPTYLYGRSKLGDLLFARGLARRLQQKPGNEKIWVNATHPGAVSTDQQEQAVDAYGLIGKIGVTLVRPFFADPESQGCRPAMFAATADEIVSEGIRGQYITPDRKIDTPTKQGQDDALGDRLWTLCEKTLSEKFGGKLPYDKESFV